MIQTDGEAAVYLVLFCEKSWIPNPPTLNGLFNNWKITHFKKNPNIAKAEAMTNGAKLIKTASDPKVYLHNNGRKFWIANPATFNKFNFDWKKIHILSDAAVNSIPTGEVINSE